MKKCTEGLWDESVPGIFFNNDGVSNYALLQKKLMSDFPHWEKGMYEWQSLIAKIKKAGEKNKYDCIIGVSGGTDSSYLLHIANEYKLRPLAINLDNGWSSEIAVNNIKKVTKCLGIDLETYVINYEEIKDLLRAYIRAGLPWVDNPTDMAIQSVLYKIANRENIKYVIVGNDFRSEGKQPTEWTYSDQKQLKYIHKKFGSIKLKTYPLVSMPQLMYYGYIRKIKLIYPFNYFEYNKQSAQILLQQKYNWEYYGEHHHENIFTKWVIGYWLFDKFKIDKRIITYSAQVLAGSISREDAILKLSKSPLSVEQIEQDTSYVLKKLDISQDEFNEIWKCTNHSFLDYPSYYKNLIRFIKIIAPVIKYIVPVKPKIFYEIEYRNKK